MLLSSNRALMQHKTGGPLRQTSCCTALPSFQKDIWFVEGLKMVQRREKKFLEACKEGPQAKMRNKWEVKPRLLQTRRSLAMVSLMAPQVYLSTHACMHARDFLTIVMDFKWILQEHGVHTHCGATITTPTTKLFSCGKTETLYP